MDKTKRLELLKEFPPVTTEQWEEVVKKDLKGADYAKKLLWQTEDGITVKPYYRAEDIDGLAEGVPGEFPYVRGTKAQPGWNIREKIDEADPAAANELARKAIESGADEVCFVIEGANAQGIRATTAQDFSILLTQIPLENVAVHFRAGEKAKLVHALVVEALGSRAAHLKGSVDYDPLGDLALSGASERSKTALFDQVAELVATATKRTPGMKVLAVRGHAFHDSGATTVQEIGFALAQAVEYVSELMDRGVSAEQAARAMYFSFAVGSNYFFEIAKLRSARGLWAQALAQFGVTAESAKATLHARTGMWGTTIYDPHVNLLRGTTGAMSAAIGGADSVSIAPFDSAYKPADDFSRRLARNTQIILKKEAYFDHVVDPGAGSYYVEKLTASVAREAWGTMQQVESAGGFLKSLEDNHIQQAIRKSRTAKDAAIAARRKNLLGTNQFPNQKERMLPKLERISPPPGSALRSGEIHVEALRPYRGAELFEALRLRVERYVAKGNRAPRILMLEIGDLKMRKARSGFATNFFACGGFEIAEATASDVDHAFSEVIEASPDAVVLCSSDPEYPQVAGPIIRKLRDNGRNWPVLVAGYPKDDVDRLRQDGVAEFIHIKSNAIDVLKTWQDKLGVRD